MTSTPSYPSAAAVAKAAEVGSGKTDEVDSSTGVTAPRVAPGRPGGPSALQDVQPPEDDALAQRPRADLDAVHAEAAHRRLGHHGTGEQLVRPARADPV